MKKLLIVIDMQNDFIDGSLGSPEAVSIVSRVTEKIRAYLASGNDVIFTLDTHGDDYENTLEGRKLPVSHCIKGTHGWELHPDLKGFPGHRFEKPAFGSLSCMGYVASCQYGQIELIGLCTDICVISNAMLLKAAVPNTPITVDPFCCAGSSPQGHETALEAMKICQIDVIETAVN